jgi:hypothetical protein
MAMPAVHRSEPSVVSWAGSIVFAAALAVASSPSLAQPGQFQVNNVPDFSQNHNAAWSNYCAPVAAADWVYAFSGTYPALRQGNPMGPGVAADNGVDAIVGGVPPAAGSLAQLMGTTPNGGTTLNGCANGLDQYLETNDGMAGNANWTTVALLRANFAAPSGQNFFNALQAALSGGSGVILAVSWPNGAPGGYEVPDPYDPTNENGPMGHALAMTGYNANALTIAFNDPADNVNALHNWPGQNLVGNLIHGANGLPNSLGIMIGGVRADIYGAVITTPIPAPGPTTLLGVAAIAFARRRPCTR